MSTEPTTRALDTPAVRTTVSSDEAGQGAEPDERSDHRGERKHDEMPAWAE